MRKSAYCNGLAVAILIGSTICYGADETPMMKPKERVPGPAPSEIQEKCYKSELEMNIQDIEEECVDKNPSQRGMNNCYGKSLEAWDKALNDIYGKLMNRLDNKNKLALKYAQREWIKYRENHYKFLDTYYDRLEGSMYVGMYIRDKASIVKDRTLDLNSLLELMDITDGDK